MARTFMTSIPAASGGEAKVIFSRNNPLIKRLRALQSREMRDRTGLHFVDGIRFVMQAIAHHAPIHSLLVSPELLTNPFGQRLVRQQRRAGVSCLRVPPEVYHSVSLAEEPQGLAAVVPQRWETLETITPRADLCWVALDLVQSPGNLGTLLRTSEAVGAAGVILIGESVDPYDPAVTRASMGALFGQRFVRTGLEEFAAWKCRENVLLVGTSPTACQDYQGTCYPAPVVLFMGGERQGLSQPCQALCDVVVKIPMVGQSDSLNLGVATSLMLYEVFNQTRRGPHTAGFGPLR